MSGRWLLILFLPACETTLPDAVEGYADRCPKLNPSEIPPYDGDPHPGMKNVYACDVDRSVVEANLRPFPEGTVIVKESTRPGESTPLVGGHRTASRTAAGARDEYTRNFSDESLRRNLAGQSICTDCHQRARALDSNITRFARPPDEP